MPELPEVETVRRGLQPVMEGALLTKVETRRPDLRFPLPPRMNAKLAGRRVEALGRRAKYLIAHFEGGPVLICHLGMSGSFRIELEHIQEKSKPGRFHDSRESALEGGADTPGEFHYARSKDAVHDHVVFHMSAADGSRARVVYNDPRRFGFMLLAKEADWREHSMIAGLGVEPTGNELDGAMIGDLFRGKAAPLKAALGDQRLIAGLGNIYVCEALWRSKLSPKRAAGTIAGKPGKTTARADALADAVREVIADAVDAGGSSLRDYMQTDGSLGYFQKSFAVYDREGAPCQREGCKGVVQRIVQSGRSTFFCPTCQR